MTTMTNKTTRIPWMDEVQLILLVGLMVALLIYCSYYLYCYPPLGGVDILLSVGTLY